MEEISEVGYQKLWINFWGWSAYTLNLVTSSLKPERVIWILWIKPKQRLDTGYTPCLAWRHCYTLLYFGSQRIWSPNICLNISLLWFYNLSNLKTYYGGLKKEQLFFKMENTFNFHVSMGTPTIKSSN